MNRDDGSTALDADALDHTASIPPAERARRTPTPSARSTPPGTTAAVDDARGAAVVLPVDPTERYEMAGVHGRGGLGRVVKAHDRRLGRTVAIKELLHRTTAGEARFVREALITARLEHPGIVPVHEAGRWPSGDPYYSMKLVSGRTLKELVLERRDLAGRLALLPHVIAVAEAIGYAHSQGVIHRDVKPSNVVVGDFGETVVVDWGLAKDLTGAVDEMPRLAPDDDGGLRARAGDGEAGGGVAPASGEDLTSSGTAAGKVMGTPAYMSPEQARGAEVDARADVFSLGAMLYEVLLGEPPYTGDSSDEVLRRAIAGPATLIERTAASALAEVPPDLIAIVWKATAHFAEDRYANAKALAEDLKRFQTGQLVTARKYSSRTLLYRWLRRHRAAVTAALAFVVAGAIAGGLAVDRVIEERNQAERARGAALEAQAAAESRSDELILLQAESSLPRNPTAAVAWLKAFPRRDDDRVAAMLDEARAGGVARHVWRHRDWVYGVAILPDGTIATADMSGEVNLHGLEDGRVRLLGRHVDASGEPLGVHDIVPSPDRRRLATMDGAGVVYLWDVASGRHRVVPTSGAWVDMIVWSPDGRRVLLADGMAVTRLVDVERGAVLATLREGFFGLAFTDDGTGAIGLDRKGVVRRVGFDGSPPGPRIAQVPPHINHVARSLDERHWLVMGKDEVNRLVDLRTGGVRELGRQPSSFATAAFSPSGRLVATGGTDTTIRVYDVATGAERVLRGHEDSVYHLLFTPDEQRLVSCSDDATIRVWDLRSGETHVLRGHEDDVVRLSLSTDGEWLASAGLDGTARLWSMQHDDSRVLAGSVAGEVRDFFFGDDGLATVVTSRQGRVERWDVAAGTSTELALPRDLDNRAVPAMSHDGRWAATPVDGLPAVVDLRSGEVHRYQGPPLDLRSLQGQFSPDSARLVAVDQAGTIVLMRMPSRAIERVARGTGARMAVFSPGGERLAVSGPGLLQIHDTASGAVLRSAALEARCAPGEPMLVTWSPDGRQVAAASKLGCSLLWDVAGTAVRPLDVGTSHVTRFAFSPDGRWLAAAGSDRKARVWDIASGERRVLGGHGDLLLSVAFSDDSDLLATASYDKTVRLWQVGSWRSRVLRGHAASVDAVAFMPGGGRLVSAARDGTLRVWDVGAPFATGGDPLARMTAMTSAVVGADGRATTPPAGEY